MGSTVTATPHHCTHLRTPLTVHTVHTVLTPVRITLQYHQTTAFSAPPRPSPRVSAWYSHTPHAHHTDTHPKKSVSALFVSSLVHSSPPHAPIPIPLQCSRCSLYRHLSHRTPPLLRHSSLSHPAQPHHACCTSAWAREGVAHIDC